MAEPKEKRTIEIIVNGQQAHASLKEMDAAAAVLYSQFRKLSADDPGRAKLVADYRAMKDRIADVKTELTGVSQNAGFMKQALANAFAFAVGGGIEAVMGKVFELGKSIFETTAKFEKYEAIMTNALGDKSKAQKAMQDIQDMAAKTPFSVDELTSSFIKFVNRGLNPSMTELAKLADLAASQGKSFDQLTEAVLDAGGGEFERLKEFGIKASKSGDQVSLSFKGITQSVKNTPEAINGAIMAFGGMQGVAGSTAAISATLEGQLSNLGDTAEQLETTVGKGLKPMFTALLTVFGAFLGWIGRFVTEAAGPLKQVFAELNQVVGDFYREIADVLKGLGLFSEQTDTVKIAVEILKVALTVLLLPIKTLLLAAKGIADVFIEWYNTSELLRGVLGGLGAVIATTFRAIKDDAIKYLGGVSDIIVGIFTLDKDKIVAGFKSALSATADLALGQGERAAKAFMTGYQANKGNHIERTVRVSTKAGADAPTPAGESLTSDKRGADAADEKKREAAEKKAAAALLKQHQAEIEAERHHQEMLLNLRETASLANDNQRLQQLRKVEIDAQRKVLALQTAEQLEALLVTGTQQEKHAKMLALEQEKNAAVALVQEEAHQKQLELQAKFTKEDAEQVQQDVADQLVAIEAAEVEKEALIQQKFGEALESQQAKSLELYNAKHAALEAELALLALFGGKETAEYRKTRAEQVKLEKDFNKQSADDARKMAQEKRQMQLLAVETAGNVVQTTIDLLFQDEAARKKHHNMYTALAGAKLIMDGVMEVAAIWKYSAENPLNAITGGTAGLVMGGIQTALAVARTVVGLTKLREFSFAQGGATGGGLNFGSGKDAAGMAVSPLSTLMEMSGMTVAPNGRLVDNTGFAVAGIVHEDEYVVPKWMRADPQVAAVEQWLEARRLRGFVEGGGTSAASTPARAGDGLAILGADGASTTELLGAMLDVMSRLDSRLANVENWQSRLEVVLDVPGHQRVTDEVKQVQFENGIRA